jgi:hypothetical protein
MALLNELTRLWYSYHVGRNQKGWAKALPKVRFDIMNTLNTLTSFFPFILKMGCLPRLLLPLLRNGRNKEEMEEELDACKLILKIEGNVWSAKDSLLMSKLSQAHYANKDRSPEPCFQVGDQVMLMTARRRHEFMQAKDG